MEINAPMEFGWPELDIALRLVTATVAGMLLGLDREVKGFDAGVRTHGMVALASSLMTVSALLLYYQLGGPASQLDPLRVIEAMAAAIGIIAAGLIIVHGGNVKNLTSAAHIWLTAALGVASGAGQYQLVIAGVALALLLLVVLVTLERWLPKTDKADDS